VTAVARRPLGDAERQRRCRARRKAGEERYVVVIPETVVVEALLRSGRLSEPEALRRDLVERALVDVLVDWSRRWLK
jgi:hypothetical protein